YNEMERESMEYFYAAEEEIQRQRERIRQLENVLTENGIGSHLGREGIKEAGWRLSHNLCKPAERCRIEAADRRYYTWPERPAPRKKTPVERKAENSCRWQTSAAWMTSRTCSRRPLPNSWRTVWRQSWMRTWATANMTTIARPQTTAGMVIAARRFGPALEMWKSRYPGTGKESLSLRC